MNPKVSLIIPLYNEEHTINLLHERIIKLLESWDVETEVVLVNDGSKDKTESLIQSIGFGDSRFQVVSLSRNFGHQLAVTAGLAKAQGTEAVMILDGDLQDPPELLQTFYKYYKQGYDIVYGVRKKRKENFIKRACYNAFYRLLKSISTVDIPLDSGDFSLVSRRVVDLLNSMPEESRFLRGMRAWTGFNQKGVEYERHARAAGDSKYTVKKLFQLAYSGIFNFSEFPVKLITRCGLISFLISLVYSLYVLSMKVFFDEVPQGFTALLFTITMFGGIQLLSIGILGEYITRIFFQSKQRPLFIIKSHIKDKKLNG